MIDLCSKILKKNNKQKISDYFAIMCDILIHIQLLGGSNMLTVNYKQVYETSESGNKEWILIIYDISSNHM